MKAAPRTRPPGSPGPPAGAAGLHTSLLPVAVALVAVLVYWDTSRYFFAQDAFALLARVRGLEQGTGGAWRWLSGEGYFRLMDALFGLNPFPYHAAQLALHALNSALAYALSRRLGLGPATATLAALFFAAHFAYLDALAGVTGIGELLASALVLAAMLVALPPPGAPRARWRVWAVTLCYAAALASKETVILFPAVLWLARRLRPGAVGAAVPPCAVVGALYLASFLLGDPFGLRAGGPGRNPYQPVWGAGLLHAWASYLWWAFGLLDFSPQNITDVVVPRLPGWVLTALLAALVALLARRARAGSGSAVAPFQAAALGVAHYLAFIAPVLPLASHAYHYYLYLPLVGLAWIPAAALEAWLPLRVRWLPWALAVLVAAHGFNIVRVLERATLPGTDLASFGAIRRAQVAERALHDLAGGEAPLPADLVVLGPRALHPADEADTTTLGRYLFTNLRAALDEGRAVRVFFPEVRSVRFMMDLDPSLTQPDVVVLDYRGTAQRGPAALLFLARAQVAWCSGLAVETLASLVQADLMARRWAEATPPGRWRERGMGGIRQRARAALATLEAEKLGPGDSRAAMWRAVRDRLERLTRAGV